jgi:hypothetical protein
VEPTDRRELDELLDEESLAVLAILFAVALEFGFGFWKLFDWWAGLIASPTAFAAMVAILRLTPTRTGLVRLARWILHR